MSTVTKNSRVASSPSLLTMGAESLKKQRTVCDIRCETSQASEETISATHRMLAMACQAESYGSKSLETLAGQKEQLQNINRKLHNIDSNIHVSNGILASMRSWFFSSWYRSKLVKLDDTRTDADTITNSTITTSHISDKRNDTESIINDNLTQLSESICRLKAQALAINHELDESNKLLHTINPTCDKVSTNLGIVTKVTSGLL